MSKNKISESDQKVPFVTSFWRSQATSLIASATDFGVYGFLLALIGINYAVASAIGNLCGAIVSFNLGRNWAFESKDGKITKQAIKYAIASICSAGLNTVVIVWLTKTLTIDPTVSKVISAILIGLTFNFLMFRYFVYKK